MRRNGIFCINGSNENDVSKLTGALAAQLTKIGHRTAVLKQCDIERVTAQRLCAEYQSEEILLIEACVGIDCPVIMVVTKESEYAPRDREELIAIAADGDMRFRDVFTDDTSAAILDRDDIEGIAAFILEYKAQTEEKESFQCVSKLILKNETDFFGPGVARLLHMIDEVGSIRRAAIEMEMSYSKAWKLIGRAETGAGIAFLSRINGGKTGGNSALTEEGRAFLRRYDAMNRELKVFTDTLYDRYTREITEE